jgi:hypothetical protein
MNQIELLLRLSENAHEEGDELTQSQNKVFGEHARKLVELSRMIDLAKANIDQELQRFSRWLPREENPRIAKQDQLPRVVAQGAKEVSPR